MIDPMKGAWLVPTYGRAHDKLPRFLASCAKSGMSTPGYLLVNNDDYEANEAAYGALDLGDNWKIQLCPAQNMVGASEFGLSLIKDTADWIGWLGDDNLPETPGWDRLAIADLKGWNVVSTNDGALAPKRMNGAVVWSGDLIRAVGYAFVPGTHHFYFDDMWERLGKMTGCWHVNMDIMVRHRNIDFESKADPTSRKRDLCWPNDERAFASWERRELVGCVDRIMGLLKTYGHDVSEAPDLSEFKVMIGTPTGSGQYERLYQAGLINTMNMLKAFGAEVVHGEVPYVSDIALARNLIFGMFLRSECTHLMFIDDDMGWEPQDVVKLMLARKDFVAVAGPRKVFPPSFAVNVSDEFGRAVGVQMDPETGFLTGNYIGIGMAFTLLSHAGVKRMAESYADLGFLSASGRDEFGVFNPMIVNRRYLSEDFAYCHRWHQIGGRILVASDVSLKHVGTHVWEGSWLDQLEDKMKRERAAA